MLRRSPLLLVLALVAALVVPASFAAAESPQSAKRGIQQLTALGADGPVMGIATFRAHAPSAQDARNLASLGLQVQRMENLPLAGVRGPVSAMEQAVARGYAYDIYPDERLELLDRDSSAAINATEVWSDLGYEGEGIGVAIVDTGVDATHPDLENRVTHNVKLVGAEYLDVTGYVEGDPEHSFVIPVDEGPYNNGDTSGHGTHVAGIVGADGSADPDLIGVAPKVDLIGYGTGDVVYIFTIVAAFDHILEHQEEWNIHVTNNSWGSSFRHFDPDHPTNLATKRLAEAGIVSVFAAGNSTDEMQVNPWSVAPWVISVGSTTLSAERSSFSSGGLMYDNSRAVDLPDETEGHLRFGGDHIGIYRPDVSAPGSNITSTGTPTGVGILAPAPPGGSATISGTSMASPQVAGLVALLQEASLDTRGQLLSVDQVQKVLQVTAAPMRDGSPFWQSGYGFVDAKAAVELVTSKQFASNPDQLLDRLQSQRDREVQAARDHSVLATDHYWFDSMPIAAFGSDGRELPIERHPKAQAVRATVAFADDLGLVGLNLLTEWGLELKDSEGNVLATSTVSGASGFSVLHVEFDEVEGGVADGDLTLDVIGYLGLGDGVWFNPKVSVAVAQLEKQQARTNEPQFKPSGELALHFLADDASTGIPSPEGCDFQEGVATGGMSKNAPSDAPCRAGLAGYAWNYGAGIPVEFTSGPLGNDTVIGGDATLVTYLAEAWQPIWSLAFASRIQYDIAAIGPEGEVIAIGGGEPEDSAQVGPTATRGEYALEIPPTEVPGDHRIRVRMHFTGFYTSTMRMLYGGGDFADSGLTMTTGRLVGG